MLLIFSTSLMHPIQPDGSTKVRDGSSPTTDNLAHPGAQQIQCAVCCLFLFFWGGSLVLLQTCDMALAIRILNVLHFEYQAI